jgi:hypothetical protein
MQSKTALSLPSPWNEFLTKLDSMLTEKVELQCIGGLVVCFFYGLAREFGLKGNTWQTI